MIKKGKLLFATTWMKLEGIMLSEIDREKQILCDITCMWNIEKKPNLEIQSVEWWLPRAGCWGVGVGHGKVDVV